MNEFKDFMSQEDNENLVWCEDLNLIKADKVISNYISYISYLSSGGDINLEVTNDIINREGNILADKNINIKARNLYNESLMEEVTIKTWWEREYRHDVEEYRESSGDGPNGDGGDGGVVTISKYGTKEYQTETTQKVGGDKTSRISAGGSMDIQATKVGNGLLSSDKNIVDNNKVNIDSVVLNNNKVSNDNTLNIENTTINTEDYIKIPSGDKGMFVINNSKNPNFTYLIETNVEFVNLEYYLGSDYLFSKLGFNPDKDIRLLGDAFYETQIVNRAILENTGARYLNGATSEREQMEILFDNSIKAEKDLNLSLGVALTKEQINNLKEDIIWYVEEEVNGIVVLVPKVYLSKETLANLDSNQSGITAGGNIKISAMELNNTGIIQSNSDVIIDVDSLLNKSLTGGGISKILGENITVTSIDDINNIGGTIKAQRDLTLESIEGDINNVSTIRVNTNQNNKITTTIKERGNIEAGSNIKLEGNKIVNIGSDIKGGEDVELIANDIIIGSDVIHNYEKTGGGRNSTIEEEVIHQGSNIVGNNVTLDAKKDIDIIGSNVIANNELKIGAEGDINVVATVDSQYYEKQKHKSKSFKRSKTETTIKYDETINSSNLISGNSILIISGNDIGIVGSNLASEGDIDIGAGNDITIISAMKGNVDSKSTSKSGFLGLSGRAEKNVETQYTNVGSYVGGVGSVNITSDNNINISGSDVESGERTLVHAKNDVNITAVDDVSVTEHSKVKYGTSLFGNTDGLSVEIGISTSIEKNRTSAYSTEVLGSNLSSDGDISILSGNNTNIEASNLNGENIDITARNKLNVFGRDEGHNVSQENKKGEIQISLGVDLNGIIGTLTSVSDTIIGMKDLPDILGVGSDLLRGESLNESLSGNEDGLNALNSILNGPSSGGTSAGLYAKISLSMDNNYQDGTDIAISNISGNNNVILKTESGNMNFDGSVITAGNDIELNSAKNINIASVVSKSEGDLSSLNLSGEYNLMNQQISGSVGVSSGLNSSESHSNAEFTAGNKVTINGDDLTIIGGNIIGNEVEINVDNFHLESVQDRGKSKDIGTNINAGDTIESGDSLSGGGGINYSEYKKEWVNEQASIIGLENSVITVTENTNIIGGLIGGGDTTLDTGTLTFSDISDKEKGTDVGVSGSLSGEGKSDYQESIRGNYGAVDREQITNATIGGGTIIVGGEETEAAINRDESKGQVVTKDISVETIEVEYDSQSRDWNEIPAILGEQTEEAVIIPLLNLEKGLPFIDNENGIVEVKANTGEEIDIYEENYIVPSGVDLFFSGMLNNRKKALRNSNKQTDPEKDTVLFHNPTSNILGDTLEAGIDKIGSEGIMSPMAKNVGELLWRSKESHYDIVAHSQGSLLVDKGFEHIVQQYGSLSELNIGTITMTGPAANVEEFEIYAKKHGFRGKVVGKNNKGDLVGSVIGDNQITTNVDQKYRYEDKVNEDKDRVKDKHKKRSNKGHSNYYEDQEVIEPKDGTVNNIKDGMKSMLEGMDYLKNFRWGDDDE